jgi:hypothetical protein
MAKPKTTSRAIRVRMPSGRRVVMTEAVKDVDLDRDVVRLKNGRRLTTALADQIVEDLHRHDRRGRPSLSGPALHSPRVSVCLPAPVLVKVAARAKREGRTISAVVRALVEAGVGR